MDNLTSLNLSAPVVVEHDWQHIWFDCCLQHLLLLNKSYFYTLSFGSKNPTPNMYYHQEDLPKNIIVAKLSLDMKIVAIQSTLLSVLVIDTTNKKKWLIDIKHPGDNVILSNGIVWSDHGGNSQDLIIVTTRGLELYKISQTRGQCKLSRIISQPGSFTFWYEPTHRMVLLASCLKSNSSMTSSSNYYDSNNTSTKSMPAHFNEILLMDGYFLKYEKSLLPVLELPPPDKAPRFELGPGVLSDNISLHTLYGKLCCLVHYTGGDNTDFITIYNVTKYTVKRTHCLSLNCITDTLKFSVYDNLLLCHSNRLKVSFIFDIQKSAKKLGEGTTETRDITDPVCEQPSRIYFTEFIAGSLESSSTVIPSSARTAHMVAAGIIKPSTITTPSPSMPKGTLITTPNMPPPPPAILPNSFEPQSLMQKIASGDSNNNVDASGEGGDRDAGEDGDDAGSEDALGSNEGGSDMVRDSNDEQLEDGRNTEEGDKSEWDTIGNSTHKISLLNQLSFPNGLSGGASFAPAGSDVNLKEYSSLTFQGHLSEYTVTQSTNCNNVAPMTHGNVPQHHTTRTGKNRMEGGGPAAVDLNKNSRLKVLSEPLFLSEVYSSELYEFRYPNLLYDKSKRITYRLVVDYRSVIGSTKMASQSYNPRENMYFLSRRGQLFMQFNRMNALGASSGGNTQLNMLLSYSTIASSAERALDYQYVSDDARKAKQLIMCEFYEYLENAQNMDLSVLENLIFSVMAPYVNEHKRQLRVHIDVENGQDAFNYNNNNIGTNIANSSASGSGNTFVVSSKETTLGMLRRKTMSDGLFGSNRPPIYRKGSFVGAGGGATNAVGVDDNSCFFLDMEPLEPLAATSASSTYLPDISRIGIKARNINENKIPSSGTLSSVTNSSALTFAPQSLTTRRDVYGNLIVTQSELLSYVWLPLMLQLESDAQFDTITWALQTYIATLRELEISLLPANSLLLMNVMFCRGQYMEVARLMQFNFFPDSSEVAMSALELRDILDDILAVVNKKSSSTSNADISPSKVALFGNIDIASGAYSQVRILSAISTLQQAALDMLLRLDEKITVVRWHLTHGLVNEAIMLCTKKLGVWRAGLSPGCISGIDFFNAAVKVINNMQIRSNISDIQMSHRLIKENEQMEAQIEREEREEATAAQTANKANSPSSSSSEPIVDEHMSEIVVTRTRSGSYEQVYKMSSSNQRTLSPFDPSLPRSSYPFRDILLREQQEELQSRRVVLMYTVYTFIREWDNSVLLVSTNLIKSKLAVQTQFPDHLFDVESCKKFKELFGFV